jgi:cytochrome c553
MNKTTCPACAGPDNATCATCHGTSEVAQETYDMFIAEKLRQESNWNLQNALQNIKAENKLGEEQSIVVITMADGAITSTVDGVDMVWNQNSETWI